MGSSRHVLRRAGLLAAAVTAVLGTGGRASGAPAVPKVVSSAEAFVDSIGVDVHLYYGDSGYYYGDSGYENTDEVINRIVESGIRHVRDNLAVGQPGSYEAFARLSELG